MCRRSSDEVMNTFTLSLLVELGLVYLFTYHVFHGWTKNLKLVSFCNRKLTHCWLLIRIIMIQVIHVPVFSNHSGGLFIKWWLHMVLKYSPMSKYSHTITIIYYTLRQTNMFTSFLCCFTLTAYQKMRPIYLSTLLRIKVVGQFEMKVPLPSPLQSQVSFIISLISVSDKNCWLL